MANTNLSRRMDEERRWQPPMFGAPGSGQGYYPGAEEYDAVALLQVSDSVFDTNGFYKAIYLGWNQTQLNPVQVRCLTDSPVDTGRLVMAVWIGLTPDGYRLYQGIAGPACIAVHNACATPQVIPPFAVMMVKGIIYQGHLPVFQVDIPTQPTAGLHANEYLEGHWHVANDNRQILIDGTKSLFLRDPFPCQITDGIDNIGLGQTFGPAEGSWLLDVTYGEGEPWMSLGPRDTINVQLDQNNNQNFNILWLTRNVMPGFAHIESLGGNYSEATPNAADWKIQPDPLDGLRYFSVDKTTNLVTCQQGGMYQMTVTGFVSASSRSSLSSSNEEQELEIDWRGSFKDSYVTSDVFKARLTMFPQRCTAYTPVSHSSYIDANASYGGVAFFVETVLADLISQLNAHMNCEKSLGNRAVALTIITPLKVNDTIGLSLTNKSYNGGGYDYPALQVQIQLDIERIGAS